MTNTGNLPSWNGASAVYRKAYRTLALMAQAGHVLKSGRLGICYPSQDMRDLITALDKGDEEQIKGLLLMTWVYPYGGAL